MTRRLPDGFTVTLRPDVTRLGEGRLLIGGSPLTALWLSAAAAALLRVEGEVTTLTVDSSASARVAERLLAGNLADPVLGADLDPGLLTVVIPVRDRSEELGRALTALRGATCLVVDDASLDPAPVRAVAQQHGAQVVSLSRNIGPGGARNAGVARVTTPFVAFVDSDVTASLGDLTRLGAHFDDPSVAVVGPLIRGRSRSPRPAWFERHDEAASSLTLGTTPANVRPGANVAYLPSACLVVRTRVLRDPAVDGFDAPMRVGEDVDLIWRLIELGWRVRYDPAVVVHHDTRGTLRAWAGRKFVYGTSAAPLAKRHGDFGAPARLSPALAVAAALVLLRHWSAVPAAVGAVARGARGVRGSLKDVPGRDVIALRISVVGLGWAVRRVAGLLLRHWWPAVAVAALCSRAVRRSVVSALVVDAAVTVFDAGRPFAPSRFEAPPAPSRFEAPPAPSRFEVFPTAPAVGHPSTRRGAAVKNLPTTLLARRVDDLAYGAGVWVGSARARTWRALAPRWAWPGQRSRRTTIRGGSDSPK